MMQMTIFEALEKEEGPVRQADDIGLKHRWLIAKRYGDLTALAGTVIPGKTKVHFLPTKYHDIGVQLDRKTLNKILKQGRNEMTYPEYQKWIEQNDFIEVTPKSREG